MRKMILALVVAAALLVALAVPVLGGGQAFADPVRNPNAVFLTADCAGVTVDVVITGPEQHGAVGHYLDSTSVNVVHADTYSVFVDGVFVFEFSGVRGRGVEDLVTCSYTSEFVDPATGATITVVGEAQVLNTPRGG